MVSESLPGTNKFSAKGLFARIAAVYGALFFGIGVSLPFLPVWLKAQALGVEQVAFVLALQSGLRVVASPLLSRLADGLGRLRPVMVGCAVAALGGMLWLAGAGTYGAIVLGVGVAYAAFAPLVPMTEAYAVACGQRFGLDYGRMRLWGSLAFIGGNLVAGAWLDVMAPARLIWLMVAAQGALLAALMLLPPRRHVSGEEGRADADAQGGSQGGAGAQGAAIAEAGRAAGGLLTPAFGLFLLAAGLVQGSHALVYGFSALHWKALGHSGAVVGMLWATGVLAEVVVFWFSARLMADPGGARLLMLGAGAAMLRWAGLSLDPPLVALFALQALHGLSFGAAHLGAMAHIRAHAPPRRAATAQAVYGAVAGGIFMTGAMWLSGPLYARFHAGAWWAMAAMAALALLLAAVLRRLSPRGRVAAG